MNRHLRSTNEIGRFRLLACGALGALLSLVPAATPARAAGLLIADGGFGGVLEIEEHSVAVTIDNGIAVTEVTQVFRNTESRVVEALYTFPVPKGASVSNFSMWIGGQEVVGEVVEKERARRIYESYKQTRRDPGLLEQVDFKTFEMRIFPIAAGAEQRVQITYYQELEFDADWATYVYPLATVSRGDLDARTRGRFALDLEIASEVPVVELGSPSHDKEFVVAGIGGRRAQASLETTGGDLGRDVVLAYRVSRPRTGFDVVASKQRGEDGYFLLTLTVGEELKEAVGGMDYVFVLDTSGSMDDDGKLALSRGSLGAFVRELGTDDRFELIAFNVQPESLFGALRPASEQTRAQAQEFLDGRRARGGTFLEPALSAAFRYKDLDRTLNVVILSDGMTEQRERRALLALADQRPPATRIFAVGVGNEVERPLLEQLAEEAGGLAAFVSRGDDFDRQARAFRRKLLRPAATGVELEFAGGGVYDLEPEKLPSLYHGMPLRLYGRYREPGPVGLSVRAEVGGELLDKTVEIELPGDGDANPQIERMWAWHRVQRLLKQADREGSRAAVVDEIVRLGEGYSIVTEYTSFLVLENDAEYRRWKIERRNALRTERDRAQQERVRRRLADLRSESTDGLGPSPVEPVRTASAPVRPDLAGPTRIAEAPQQRQRSNGADLDLGGGGAVDPLSAGIAAALAGLGLARLRRRR